MGLILKVGSKNRMVGLVQKALHLKADCIYGPLTAEAVKEFQTINGLKPDGIVGASTLTRLLGFLLIPSKRVITEIIVHCTATPAGRDYTVGEIRDDHIHNRGWSDIGYHYVIYRDGTIHSGRDVDIAGAHCAGHNTHSIGVCYVGGCARDGVTPRDTRTAAQITSLRKLLTDLKYLYPGAKIYGHRNFANKACPSFDAKKEFSNI